MSTLTANVFIGGDLYLKGTKLSAELAKRVNPWVLSGGHAEHDHIPAPEAVAEPVEEPSAEAVVEPEPVVEKPAPKRGRPRKPAAPAEA